ncbi:hypothetical protein [Nonomuraea sp. B19D2]|uniref:hypothetical protein n=1 Tax=Nonomuraea sp. B19D2 TaxID=3159561 RepID=UPI0032DB95D9
MPLDELLQLRIASDLAFFGMSSPDNSLPLSLKRVVLAGTRVTVATHLPADRGRIAVDLPGDRTQRVPSSEQVGDDDALLFLQKPRRDGVSLRLLDDRRIQAAETGEEAVTPAAHGVGLTVPTKTLGR